MLAWGVSTYGLPVDTIAGHGDYASTNCPGAALRDLLDDGSLHQSVTDLLTRVRSPSTSSPATP